MFPRVFEKFFQVAVSGTKILHLGKCSFSECHGNAEIGWMTSKLLDIKIAFRNGKQPSRVKDTGANCFLARIPQTPAGTRATVHGAHANGFFFQIAWAVSEPPSCPVPELGRRMKLAKFYKFLAGSFSAVSKRNFARKYAFDSIFQTLQDLHTFAPLWSQILAKNLF